MGSYRGQYRESLHVPVSYWLLSVPVIAILGAEVFAGFAAVVAISVYAAFVVVVGGFLLAWGRTRIEVGDGVLRAGRDAVAVSQIGEVQPLDAAQAALMGGPRADPAARLLLRPYLKRAVYVELPDPQAGAPYWLIATRHPDELAAALTASRATVG